MNANVFGALQNHLSGRIIWCNASLFVVSRFHILFNAFGPSAGGNGPGRGTTVALVRSIAVSLAAETVTRTITESAVVRETVTVRETARETESVSGSIAVSWRGRCVSVCLCLCLSPLCLQDSDVHAEVRITGMCVPEPIMFCHVCFLTANIFFLFIYECSMIWVLWSLTCVPGLEAVYCAISAPAAINCPTVVLMDISLSLKGFYVYFNILFKRICILKCNYCTHLSI